MNFILQFSTTGVQDFLKFWTEIISGNKIIIAQ